MQSQIDRDLAGRSIGDQHRHGQGIDPRGASGGQLVVLFMHCVESTDPCSQHHGHSGWIKT